MAKASVRPRATRARFDYADHLAQQVRALRLPDPVREHRFDPVRRWRFDLCWPDRMIFVECDGGEFVKGSLGRHGTGRDWEKQNAAVLLGWRPFRFVGSQIRSGYALRVLQDALAVKATA